MIQLPTLCTITSMIKTGSYLPIYTMPASVVFVQYKNADIGS